uniref:Uncharacterized protein n=1 Tax=Arundo donax TaxID=35708 RepID=A0A0A9AE60_ARUDO
MADDINQAKRMLGTESIIYATGMQHVNRACTV